MDPKDTELEGATVSEAIAVLLHDLPKPVQDFVTGSERERIALSLSQKYRLHADQAGEFEQAYLHMLLGISSPEEFVDTLTKAGIAPESVRGLANDVNEQVFVPLRKAEQEPTPAQERVVTPAVVATPPPIPAAPILPGSTEPVPQATPQQVVPPPTHHSVPAVPPPHMLMYPPYAVPYGTPLYMVPLHHPQQVPVAPAPDPLAPSPQLVQPPIVPQHSVQEIPRVIPQSPPTTPIQKEYAADPYREPFTQ